MESIYEDKLCTECNRKANTLTIKCYGCCNIATVLRCSNCLEEYGVYLDK